MQILSEPALLALTDLENLALKPLALIRRERLCFLAIPDQSNWVKNRNERRNKAV